ncbi:hypothetical protein QM012_003958 [Aureobasidium pullulans]|uniref:N-alpha-acetyltransferase 40 n=1 Tax=Aureobasidium pullulans TaxID=5580 RepID=A0ABR0T8L9_AURPU
MTSAATEREIDKWRLWGINKFLDVNVSLSLKQEKNGDPPPSLDLISSIYRKSEEEAKQLLKDARSSLKEMDIRWVIFGACQFLDQFPLRTSKENGHVLLKRNDVFRTFGKKESQGMKLYSEAAEAYSLFKKVRDLNNLPLHQFIEDYMHAGSMECTPQINQESGLDNGTSMPGFEISLSRSSDLFGQVGAETTESIPKVPRTLFELIKHTSYNHYKASSQGWDDTNKLDEMKDGDMHYLIIRLNGGQLPELEKRWSKDSDLDQTIVGFLSFMITQEEEENVIYIYEIHISEHFRNCGLGRHLFNVVESIGGATDMDKAMLTVFRCNVRARRWYDSRGYEVDKMSPRPRKLRGGRSIEPDYEILSKHLQKEPTKKNKS